MSDDRAAGALERVAELEDRDAELASLIDRVAALLQKVDEIRGEGARVRGRLSVIPAALEAVERAERDARRREASARAEQAEAERRVAEVARSRRAGSEARAQADRDLDRTRAAVVDAAAHVGRITADRSELLGEQRALRAQGEGLGVAARDVATGIRGLPRVSESGRAEPSSGLAALEEWGARAHAALFVVRSGLETERERIVDEARVLGAAVLGDHLAGLSVSLVLRRLQSTR